MNTDINWPNIETKITYLQDCVDDVHCDLIESLRATEHQNLDDVLDWFECAREKLMFAIEKFDSFLFD